MSQSAQLKNIGIELWRLLAILSNYTFIGPIKMTIEAIRGRTSSGDTLTLVGRINHVIIQSANVLAYVMFFRGSIHFAGRLYAFSWLMDSIQYYPEILGGLGRLAVALGIKSFGAYCKQLKIFLDTKGLKKVFFST